MPLPSTIPRGCSASQKWSRAVSTPCSEQHFPLSSPAWGQLYGAGGWRRQSKAVLLDPAEPSQSPRCAQHQRAPGPQLRGGLLEHHRCCAPPNGTTSVPTPQAGTKLPQPGKVRAWLRGAAPGPIPPRKNPPRSISSIKVGAGGCPPPQTTSTYLGHRLPGGRAGRAPRSTAAPSSRAGPWLRRDRVGGVRGVWGGNFPRLYNPVPAAGRAPGRPPGSGAGTPAAALLGGRRRRWAERLLVELRGGGGSAGSSPPCATSPGPCGVGTPKSGAGAGSRAPPQALRPASGKGRGSAGLLAPGPSCPPGHHGGRVPAARRARSRAHRSR